jgi:hypothetical protein
MVSKMCKISLFDLVHGLNYKIIKLRRLGSWTLWSDLNQGSQQIGFVSSFPFAQRGRGVMLTTHPHLVPRSWISRSYIYSPPKRLHGV